MPQGGASGGGGGGRRGSRGGSLGSHSKRQKQRVLQKQQQSAARATKRKKKKAPLARTASTRTVTKAINARGEEATAAKATSQGVVLALPDLRGQGKAVVKEIKRAALTKKRSRLEMQVRKLRAEVEGPQDPEDPQRT